MASNLDTSQSINQISYSHQYPIYAKTITGDIFEIDIDPYETITALRIKIDEIIPKSTQLFRRILLFIDNEKLDLDPNTMISEIIQDSDIIDIFFDESKINIICDGTTCFDDMIQTQFTKYKMEIMDGEKVIKVPFWFSSTKKLFAKDNFSFYDYSMDSPERYGTFFHLNGEINMSDDPILLFKVITPQQFHHIIESQFNIALI
jgi:hypothetical protein